MSKRVKRFEQFATGDHVVFEHGFSRHDFELFSQFSADRNPLHHDVSYCSEAGFDAPVVPLHLTAAPLSAIAGMMLPGDPALYLGHELRALKPVYYDQTLTYSARITAIHAGARILEISVIALRGKTVVLEGSMRVKVREAAWTPSTKINIESADDAREVLITGASGAVGGALARCFAEAKWNLLLTYGSDKDAAEAVVAECRELGATVECIPADLSDADDLGVVVEAVAARRLGALIHTASPPLTAEVEKLVAINYQSLAQLSESAVPGMLCRQQGCIVTIGSTAMEYFPEGWADYVAAKGMAVSLVAGIERHHRVHGVRGITVAPGFVKTRFSEAHRPANAGALLPEEVAETVFDCVDNPDGAPAYVSLEVGSRRDGAYGFFLPAGSPPGATAFSPPVAIPGVTPGVVAENANGPAEAGRHDALADLVRGYLGLAGDVAMATAGMGLTEGWDSLKHVEILLLIERTFGISFSSSEIDGTTRFSDLEQLWRGKVSQRTPI